jgi:hypothetical protein
VPTPPPAQHPPPLEPKPTTLLAALIVAGVLVFNIGVHGDSYVTYGLVVGLCGVLGFDLSRFWPWGRDR